MTEFSHGQCDQGSTFMYLEDSSNPVKTCIGKRMLLKRYGEKYLKIPYVRLPRRIRFAVIRFCLQNILICFCKTHSRGFVKRTLILAKLRKSSVKECIFDYIALHIEGWFNKSSLLRSYFLLAGLIVTEKIFFMSGSTLLQIGNGQSSIYMMQLSTDYQWERQPSIHVPLTYTSTGTIFYPSEGCYVEETEIYLFGNEAMTVDFNLFKLTMKSSSYTVDVSFI